MSYTKRSVTKTNVYNPEKEWEKHWIGRDLDYPSEYLVRILKGSHPRQSFHSLSLVGKKVCDVGCGSGGNLAMLKKCGLHVYGVEVTSRIAESVKSNLEKVGVKSDIRAGTNASIPFENDTFDFLVSWNACYYMGANRESRFESHVAEFARVLKSGGYCVLSIPKKTSFIFKSSIGIEPGYQLIANDPSGVRNGEILRMFSSEEEIERVFSPYFTNFTFGSQEDDCFGLDYHWHLVVCEKR